YSIYGDYSRPNPPAALIDAVARGQVDVAIAWGPLAGYFAKQASTPLSLVPVTPRQDSPSLRFVFDISMGVRREDQALRAELDQVIAWRRTEIRRLLEQYGVPLVGDVPQQRLVTANGIHIPTGRPVELELESADVIHSFWIPRLHGKVDFCPWAAQPSSSPGGPAGVVQPRVRRVLRCAARAYASAAGGGAARRFCPVGESP